MSKEEKQGGSTLLARIFFPTASALYDTATGKNIWTGNGGMIGGFDDRDWDKLFGVFGGAEPDEEDETARPADPDDTQAILKLDKEAEKFDVEEATGEPEYLKQAKAYAKKAGYKDASSLKLADDGKHKLILRGVKFGSINNNDYIIYKQHFPAIADKKRKQYLARACKIKGDWAKDKYSPNSLAINILWDGSSKKGGEEPEDADLNGGAIPINKKLYERVKREIYPLYKKPSAYRSGAVVKRYKDLVLQQLLGLSALTHLIFVH